MGSRGTAAARHGPDVIRGTLPRLPSGSVPESDSTARGGPQPGVLDRRRPTRALAIYAHPDDPEVGCGGTLARWIDEGCEAAMVVVCGGDKGSSDPGADPGALVVRRAEEVRRAAAVLGVTEVVLLGIPDGDVEDTAALRSALVGLVRTWKPEVVLCPDPTAELFGRSYWNHRDHRVVGRAVLDAVAPAAASPHYFPDQGPPHHVDAVYLSGTLEPDLWVDIGPGLEAKAAAIACHESQVGETDEWLRTAVLERAQDAGRAVGVAHAEAFRTLVL